MLSYFNRKTHAAPLAIFRITMGVLLFISLLRFSLKGWINELYIEPKYFFSYYGFEFIKPLNEFTYVLFIVCAISALMVALGFLYRAASIMLFLSFTYIELMDRSAYLNHYYYVSIILFLLIFLPARNYFSVDAFLKPTISASQIPKWTIDAIKLMSFILYFYAGLAKINSDWLIHALPLKIWLPANNDFPIIGWLFDYPITAVAFSWIACIYDLTIVFFLLYKPTRIFGYLSVIIFHGLTAVLFPIGMFPYVMIAAALIFFPADTHLRIIQAIKRILRLKPMLPSPKVFSYPVWKQRALLLFFSLFFCFQFLFPFRYLLYPGELFWTEQGYRFSWRVMLMEKAGYAQFTVKDAEGRTVIVNNTEFLTTLQEKMMSTQPDIMLQYAHILRDHYTANGFKNPEVYVDAYVALNGRPGRTFINPETNLAKEKDSFAHKDWILPLNDEIKGF